MKLHQITLFQELKKYQVTVIFEVNLTSFNVNASEFRPKGTAAIIVSIKMNDMVANETDGE